MFTSTPKFFWALLCTSVSCAFIQAMDRNNDPDVIGRLVSEDNIEELKKLRPLDGINQYNSRGLAPLHYAKNEKMVKFLLNEKADLNIQSKYGKETPLFFAVEQNKKDLVSDFLKHKANANIRDCQERKPIQQAIFMDNTDLVLELIPHTDLTDNDNLMIEIFDYAICAAHPLTRKTGQLLEELIIEGFDFLRFIKYPSAKELNDRVEYRNILIRAEDALVRYAKPVTEIGSQIRTAFYDNHQNCFKTVEAAAKLLNRSDLVDEFKICESGDPKNFDVFIKQQSFVRGLIEQKAE